MINMKFMMNEWQMNKNTQKKLIERIKWMNLLWKIYTELCSPAIVDIPNAAPRVISMYSPFIQEKNINTKILYLKGMPMKLNIL